jgi:hypothetical protein
VRNLLNLPFHESCSNLTSLTILKFSVPEILDTEDISSSLQDKFQGRLGKRIYITRTVRTFDRVAL